MQSNNRIPQLFRGLTVLSAFDLHAKTMAELPSRNGTIGNSIPIDDLPPLVSALDRSLLFVII